MSYVKLKTANFGLGNAGLATVGYTLYTNTGTISGSRVTSGVSEVPAASGCYQAEITIPDPFDGSIVWDTGTSAPAYASESFADPRNDLTQAVPTSNTSQTVGDALNAARAQGFGKWSISGTALTLYAADGTTAVRTFTLDSASAPTSRS